MAWSSTDLTVDLVGPWRELLPAAPGLAFVDSEDTLSRVFHELKWSLPDGTSLAVAPVSSVPKIRGLAPGTQTWLRERLPRSAGSPPS
jgi:hypothetical protein